MTDFEIEIREIKETLKKMQADIKRLEGCNFQFYPAAYKYSPEIPTQGCSQEELMKSSEIPTYTAILNN